MQQASQAKRSSDCHPQARQLPRLGGHRAEFAHEHAQAAAVQVRHRDLTIWWGESTQSFWIAGPAGLVGFGTLFLFRVGKEEQMMLDTFGEDYRAYMKRTARLIPWIY